MNKWMIVTAVVLSLGVSAMARDEKPDEGIKKAVAGFVSSWNKHDPKAMADSYVKDGDLVNPAGRTAKGHDEIVALFTDEQTGPFKNSTMKMTVGNIRMIGEHHAFVDTEGDVTGADLGPNRPQEFKHHVVMLMGEHDDVWKMISVRPYAFTPGALEKKK